MGDKVDGAPESNYVTMFDSGSVFSDEQSKTQTTVEVPHANSEDVEQKSNADEQVKIEPAEVQTPEEAVEDVEQLSNADEVVKMEPAEVQTPEDVEQISSADEHLKAQKRINVPNVPPG